MYPVIATAGLPHASGLLTAGDVVVIVFVLGSMAVGFWSGFLWQFVRIGGVVASLYVSMLYCPAVTKSLGTNVPEQMRQVVGAGVVFIGALVTWCLLTHLLRHMIDAVKPELPDRVLGAVFGMFKGAVLVGVAAFLLIRFLPTGDPVRERVEDSKGALTAATCVRVFLYVLPEQYSGDREPSGAAPATQAQGLRFGQEPQAIKHRQPSPVTTVSGNTEVTL